MKKTLLLAVAMTFASSAFAAENIQLAEQANNLTVDGVVVSPNKESISKQINTEKAYVNARDGVLYDRLNLSKTLSNVKSNQLVVNGDPFPDVERINMDIEFAKALANTPAVIVFNTEDVQSHANNDHNNFLNLDGHLHPDLEAIQHDIEFERALRNAPAAVVFDTEATQQNVKVNYAQ